MRRLISIAVLVAADAFVARADSVRLKNGAEYEGILKEVTADHVIIQSDGADWTFGRDKVASWKRNQESVVREKARARANLDALNAQVTAHSEEASARRRRVIAAHIADDSAAAPSVVIYGTSWCGFCRKARAFFDVRHVPYLDKDIERDREAHDEMLSKCTAHRVRYSGVPVIDVGGQLLLGFNPQELDRLLAHAH